jgi:hypothetical protein
MAMRILVQSQEGVPIATLAEPDDFGRFEVRIADVTESVARTLLANVAVFETGYAFVESEDVFLLPGSRPESDEWRAKFIAMVDYARAKGWVDQAGRIRAHVIFDSCQTHTSGELGSSR